MNKESRKVDANEEINFQETYFQIVTKFKFWEEETSDEFQEIESIASEIEFQQETAYNYKKIGDQHMTTRIMMMKTGYPSTTRWKRRIQRTRI